MKITIYVQTMRSLLALIACLLFTTCGDDFINIPDRNTLNASNFYKTKDDFNSAVIAAYAKMQGQVSQVYFELAEWRSDDLDLSAPTAGDQDRYNINKFQETPANKLIQTAWANLYNTIYRCNQVTARIGQTNFDATLKKQYEAEARFLRALMYFNIVRFWGDAPMVLRPITSKQALSTVRSPADTLYNNIRKDLTFAIENLPATHPTTSFGRATSGAAQALLGKVYLTERKYTEAVGTLRSLMAGGQYQLLPQISEVFNVKNKQNKEIIFSIRFNKAISKEGHGLWFSVSDVSTSTITPKLRNAYQSADTRKPMIALRPSGALFVPGKFYDTESSSTREFGNDYILLRYADVLLMMAEALNEGNYVANGEALALLNQVRRRAGLAAYDASTRPLNQAAFRTAVLKERFLELPLEGHRWFDLKRTNTASDQLAPLIGKTVQPYQLVYPVPQSEVEKINNKTIFSQNEGY